METMRLLKAIVIVDPEFAMTLGVIVVPLATPIPLRAPLLVKPQLNEAPEAAVLEILHFNATTSTVPCGITKELSKWKG